MLVTFVVVVLVMVMVVVVSVAVVAVVVCCNVFRSSILYVYIFFNLSTYKILQP